MDVLGGSTGIPVWMTEARWKELHLAEHPNVPLSVLNETRHHKSPKRILVRLFHQSRDRWKRKYQELKADLKRAQVKVYDLKQSQQHWKDKAHQRLREQEELQEQLRELEGQLTQAREALKKNPR